MRSRKIPISNDTEPEATAQAPGATETQADIAEATSGTDGRQPETAALEDLSRQLEAQKRLAAEKQDQYLRALADLENVRRRARLDQEAAHRFGNEAILLKLLPILDNFERALSAASDTQNAQSLTEGVTLILKQFQEALKSEGVEPIVAVGQAFDPQFHEAVGQVPASESHPENTVVHEAQKGYILNGRVIRPSHVLVAKA